MNSFNKKIFIFTLVILVVIAAFTIINIQSGTKKSERIESATIPKNTESAENTEDEISVQDVSEAEAPQINNTDIYTGIISKYMEGVQGNCQWGYCLFPENISFSTESFAAPSASIIKVFIMEYAFDSVKNGKISLTDTLEGVTVEDLIYSMITVSDNNSTNILISEFGMDELNNYFAANGYSDTNIQRKMLDAVAQSEGKDNYTSLSDVMKFLTKLYSNKEVKPYSDMLEIMKQQKVSTKIRRKFAPDAVIANKTGELRDVENDIGIIFVEDNALAIAFLCSSLPDTLTARNAISDASFELAQTIQKTE